MSINDFSTRYTKELNVVSLSGVFVVGVAGAVLGITGTGIKSVVKLTDDGSYEIELEKAYKFLDAQLSTISIVSTGSGVAKIEVKGDPSRLSDNYRADGKFIIQCYDYAGAKVNPAVAAGPLLSAITMNLSVRTSSNGPWD